MTTRKILPLLSAFICVHLWFPCSSFSQQLATRPSPSEVVVDWEKLNAEAIDKFRAYLRVDTSNPPGTESRGVEWLKKIFDAEGIAHETAESAPGRGNVVARLRGTGGEPALVLLNHIDVVPVNEEFWTAPPFSGELRDAAIWGRGALDMKSQGIAQLMAFLTLHRAKVPLRRDVIFLATADEEAGGEWGAGWVARQKPEWIRGAGFLLNEGAFSAARADGQPLFIGVAPTEKTPAWLKLTATGTPGHGSIPRPESAVNRLIAALERLRTYEPPLEVTPPIERALKTLAPYETEPWRSRLADIRAFVAQPEARRELARRPLLLALLTNTVSITGLEGTKKINIIPPVATALVDCRLLPGWTAERWIGEVRRILADPDIKIELVLSIPPTESRVDTSLYRAIADAVKAVHPQAGVAESLIAGFTDSHFFRVKGIVSYGFGPFALPPDIAVLPHGNDERIPVRSFTDGVRLTWEVVYRFARGD